MWKYILAWVPMVLIAIANAVVRETCYGKHLSELQAHQISTATGVLLFGAYIWVLIRIWRPESPEARILCIGGSPRVNGNSDIVLKTIVKTVHRDIETETIKLRDYCFQSCIDVKDAEKTNIVQD